MARTPQNPDDARVRKTRAKLFSAFLELLSTKCFEDITINEICDNAEVRRATFYKHFADKYDFLAVLTSSLIEKFEKKSENAVTKNWGSEYHICYVRELMHYLEDNEQITNLILSSNMVTTLFDIIAKENYKNIKVWLSRGVENGDRLVASVDYVALMLSGGIASIVMNWFSGERSIPLNDILSEMEKLIKAMFISEA